MCSHFQRHEDDMLYCHFDTRMKLDNKTECEELLKMIDKLKPDVVVIDPLVKFHTKDENSAQEMSQVLNVIRNLIDDKKVSVILVHHMGKSGDSGARGSSAILGEYDSYAQIEKGKGKQKLKYDFRHSETPDPVEIKFNPETFWFERDKATNPLILILQQHGEMERKTLAEKLVEGGYFKPGSSSQNKIKKDLERGIIVERNKKICLP
jgi:hypothetical protein